MAAEVFKISGKIDVNGVDQAKKDIKDVTGEAETSSSKLGGIFGKIGKGIGATAKVIGTGITVAAGAIGGLTAKGIAMAGELEQNMGGSEAVFKEHAEKMQETAKKAFSNMGLSTSDYLATANKMGALFQGAGFSIEESMNLSSDAMQRAADVASIMGIDTEAAMEAVAGAAKGNFTMMDNLGVAMNDTTLNAYALEKGIGKTTQEMTNQEKIGLAMELFMEKTAYAAGNYAKENETLAGSLGTAKAALSNFLSGAGTVEDVVSSFTNAANVIVKNIKDLFPKLMTGLTQLVNQLVPQIPPLLKELLPPLIDGAVSLVNGIVDAMPQLISALLGALPALLDGIMQIMNSIIAALPQLMEMLVGALPTLIPLLIDGLITMIVTLCNSLGDIIQPIIDNLPEIIISIVDALMENLPALIEGAIALVLGIVQAIPQIQKGLIDAIPTIIKSILKGVINAFPTLLKGVLELFTGLWKAMFGVSDEQVGKLKNFLSNAWNAIKNVASNAWNGIKNTFSSVWNGIKNTASNIIGGIKNAFVNAWNNIKTTTSRVWNGIKEAIMKPINKARDLVEKAINKIKSFFDITLKFKGIKTPKISIKWSQSPKWMAEAAEFLGMKGVPKFSVKWNAEGAIFKKPTIFSTPEGYQGVGDAGAEAVLPIDKMQGYVHAAVREEVAGLNHTAQRIYDLLANFLPAMANQGEGRNPDIDAFINALAALLAPKMDMQLGTIYARKARY